MKQRVLSGVVIAVVAISVLLLMNTVVFPIVWTVLAVMAVYEIEKVTQIKNKALVVLSLAFSALFLLLFRYLVEKSGRNRSVFLL